MSVTIDHTGQYTNPKDCEAVRAGKCRLDLLPPAVLRDVADVLAHGAGKYGPWNWRREPPRMSVYFAATMRHLLSWYEGTDDDTESGLSHLAHAMATLAIISDAIACGTAADDRPRTEGEH